MTLQNSTWCVCLKCAESIIYYFMCKLIKFGQVCSFIVQYIAEVN